jgi:hypothetical protein
MGWAKFWAIFSQTHGHPAGSPTFKGPHRNVTGYLEVGRAFSFVRSNVLKNVFYMQGDFLLP